MGPGLDGRTGTRHGLDFEVSNPNGFQGCVWAAGLAFGLTQTWVQIPPLPIPASLLWASAIFSVSVCLLREVSCLAGLHSFILQIFVLREAEERGQVVPYCKAASVGS